MRSKRNYFFSAVIIGTLLGGLCYYAWKAINPAEEGEEIVLPFMKPKESIHVWYNDESLTDYVNGAAVVYGDENGVRVIPQLVSERDYIEAVNDASVRSEQVPDVFLLNNDSLEKAYLSGLASEIDDVMDIVNPSYFPEVAINAVTYKDKLVAYPLYFESSVLLYNQTYLQEWALQQAQNESAEAEAPYDETTIASKAEAYMETAIPQTIEDLLQLADTFDPPENVEGIFKWDVSDIFYNYYVTGNYMQVGGENGDDRDILNIVNPETIQCLEVYKKLNQFFYIESDTVSYESVVQDFLDGKLVFTIISSDAAARLAEAKADGSFAFEYGAVTMPDPSKELKGRSLSVTGAIAVNSYSEHKESANKFAAYLAGEYAGNLYDKTGKCPVNYNIIHSVPLLDVFYKEYERSISLPKIMETSNFWMQLEIVFSKIWNGADVTETLTELERQMQLQIYGSAKE